MGVRGGAVAALLPEGVRTAPHAVVVGLDCITGLQTVRILAARGVPVIAITSDPDHYCARTRVCEEVLVGPTAGEGLIELLESLGPRLPQRAVLVPCTDQSVLALSHARERLDPWFAVPLADIDVIDRLLDKGSFAEFAQQHSIPVPATVVVRGPEDAERAASALLYPCVVKPALKSRAWERNADAKAVLLSSPQAWEVFYEDARHWADDLVVQEYVPGGDEELYSCNCCFSRDNEPLVTFVARKLRQWPPGQGMSSLGEEVRNDAVAEVTVRLFQAAGFRGLGYVEMKRHPRTGELVVIEPNVGRPTGRSAIAELGGVDLLLAAYCDALGLPLPPDREQRYRGAKWVHLRGDAQSALYYWRRGELSLREWVRSWRGLTSDAVFSLRDQGPFWADLRDCGVKAWRRRRRRSRPGAAAGEAPPAGLPPAAADRPGVTLPGQREDDGSAVAREVRTRTRAARVRGRRP